MSPKKLYQLHVLFEKAVENSASPTELKELYSLYQVYMSEGREGLSLNKSRVSNRKLSIAS